MGLYRFYGQILECPFPLRSVPPLPDGAAHPTLRLVLGDVPENLETPAFTSAVLQIGVSGDALLHLPRVGRIFLPAGGAEIVVALHPTGSQHDLDVLLSPAIAAILLHARRTSPMHAAVVETDDGAVMLCGASCSGKSTVAAVLVQRGARLLCDDVAAVSIRDGKLWVAPGTTWLRLWPDALCHLGVAEDRRIALREGQQKTAVQVPVADAEVPVRAIVLLGRNGKRQPAAERRRLTTMEILERRPDLVYADNLTTYFQGAPEAFALATAIPKLVPVWLMPGPYKAPIAEACADEVTAVLQETAAQEAKA